MNDQQTDPVVAKRQKPPGSLQQKLFRSHLNIVAIGLGILVVALVSTIGLRSYMLEMMEVREPKLRAAKNTLSGVHRSLADLRGWVALGSHTAQLKTDRAITWTDEIQPAFLTLKNLSQNDEEQLIALGTLLDELKEIQWWIEDIAHTPGNEPARRTLTTNIQPIALSIRQTITTMIDEEVLRQSGNTHLLGAMADFRGAFSQSENALTNFVTDAGPEYQTRFDNYLQITRDRLELLKTQPNALSAYQRTLLNHIQTEFIAYQKFSETAITLRKTDAWNVAQHMMTTQALPLSDQITEQLTMLLETQNTLLQKDKAFVSNMGNATIALLITLMISMLLTASILSKRNAKRLTQPIEVLVSATQTLSSGQLKEDIIVTDDGELGELTKSFNAMRVSLQEGKHALQEREERLRSVVDNTVDGIITIDDRGQIESFNAAAEKLFGYTEKEVIGQNVKILMPEPYHSEHDGYLDNYNHTRQAQIIGIGREVTGLHKSGNTFPLYLAVSEIQLDDQKIFTGIVRDITQQKQTEEDLRQAKEEAEAASIAKSTFLANMSHEIRTPMNGIIGMTELVLNTDLQPDQKQYLNFVQVSADALLHIINDILDFSKIEAEQIDFEHISFNLRDSLVNMVKTLSLRASEKNLELICDVDNNVPEILIGDPARLRQIIVNLVGNAIKFTDAGEILVKAKVEWQNASEAQLRFSVTDTGIGIAKDKQESIFSAFSQASSSTARLYGGTGLGLAISSRLVELMGGKIWVESELDQGSTFSFTAQLDIGQEAHTSPALGQVKDVRALVVDDNATNLHILENMLISWDMIPESVDSGAAALAALKKAHTLGTPYPLILADVHMPEMDGFTLIEHIKRDTQLLNTSVIMLTSANQPGDLARCRELGISAHLLKPVAHSELLEAIQATLAQQNTPIEAAKLEANKHPIDTTPLHILLAEDNDINQVLAVTMLEAHKHTVVVAENGNEVLEALERETFDLIFMDIQMPKLDGLSTTKKIRAAEKTTGNHIPIIAMTAYAMKGDRERCLAAGMDDYISKPIRLEDLLHIISGLDISPDTSQQSMPEDQVLDQNTALQRMGGDTELLKTVVDMFLDRIPDLMKELETTVETKDAPALEKAAHTIKGLAGNFEAAEAFSAAFTLECMGRDKELHGLLEAYQHLEREMTRLIDALKLLKWET